MTPDMTSYPSSGVAVFG